jgi:hypothetical protein
MRQLWNALSVIISQYRRRWRKNINRIKAGGAFKANRVSIPKRNIKRTQSANCRFSILKILFKFISDLSEKHLKQQTVKNETLQKAFQFFKRTRNSADLVQKLKMICRKNV